MRVLLVIHDYHNAGATWPDNDDSIATDGPRAEWIEHALSRHLSARVTPTGWGADPRNPRAMTFTVTGATPTAVADAAEFYLSSAGIRYELRGAA